LSFWKLKIDHQKISCGAISRQPIHPTSFTISLGNSLRCLFDVVYLVTLSLGSGMCLLSQLDCWVNGGYFPNCPSIMQLKYSRVVNGQDYWVWKCIELSVSYVMTKSFIHSRYPLKKNLELKAVYIHAETHSLKSFAQHDIALFCTCKQPGFWPSRQRKRGY